jgi:transposase-like protein
VFIKINGQQHYLWHAADQHDVVLDILVQSRWNAKEAKHFLRKLLKGLRYVPRLIVTDKLKSYAPAKRQSLPESSICKATISTTGRRTRTSPRPTLEHLAHCCHGDSRPDCPILEELAH